MAETDWFLAMTDGIRFFPQNNQVAPIFALDRIFSEFPYRLVEFSKSELTPLQARLWSMQSTHQHLKIMSRKPSIEGAKLYVRAPKYRGIIEKIPNENSNFIAEERFGRLWTGLRNNSVAAAARLALWTQTGTLSKLQLRLPGNSKDNLVRQVAADCLKTFTDEANNKKIYIALNLLRICMSAFSTPEAAQLSEEYIQHFDTARVKTDEVPDTKPPRNFVKELIQLIEDRARIEFSSLSSVDRECLVKILFLK